MNASVTMKRSALCFCLLGAFLILAFPGAAPAQIGNSPALPSIKALSDLGVWGNVGIMNQGTSVINGSAASRGGILAGLDTKNVLGTVFDAQYFSRFPDESVLSQFSNTVADAYEMLVTTRGQVPLADYKPAGFTLQPGVYFVQNALRAAGRLVFDARGNEGATWIMQCKHSLTIDPNTTFELLNGAKAENIFWAAERIDVGTLSSIVGTFVCRDNITLQNGTTVTGRVLAGLGLVTMFETTVDVPGFIAPPPKQGGADGTPLKSLDVGATLGNTAGIGKSIDIESAQTDVMYGFAGGGPGTQAQCTWTIPSTNCGSPQAGAGWTVGTGTTTSRLYRDGVASTCGGKAYPGILSGNYVYDKYTFMNEASAAACVTVTFTLSAGNAYAVHPQAYQGSFDPNNRAGTYKGDVGSSPSVGVPVSFGFTIPAGQAFVVVIEEVYAGYCATAVYNFTVSGSICPDMLPCAENFDALIIPALPVGWAKQTLSGNPADGWMITNTNAQNGPQSAFVPDVETWPWSVQTLETRPMQCISPAATVSFWMWLAMEDNYDGVVFEISINNGPWTDLIAAGGFYGGLGYTGPIWYGPLEGRNAWTGWIGQWVPVVANLPAAANGQSIRVRWLSGCDDYYTYLGFWLDNMTTTGLDCMACILACAPNVIVSNTPGKCEATVNYAVPGTSGNCGTVTCAPPPGSVFQVGTTPVTCTSTKNAVCGFSVTVNDTEKPQIFSGGPVTISTDPGVCGKRNSNLSVGTTASDNCPGVTLSNNGPAVLPVGITNITWTATDAAGNKSTVVQQITVVDKTPPQFYFTLYPTTLVPANQTMRSIRATISLIDNCPGGSYKLTSIKSSDPDAGLFPGDLPNDIQAAIGSPATSFMLRAERGWTSRLYTVKYEGIDQSGNKTGKTSWVTVPANAKEAVAIGNNTLVPSVVELEQNYPNPFNPSTMITYGLPADGHARLTVYDMYGRVVSTLVNEEQLAGTYTIQFIGSELASGTYTYVLESNGVVLKRMMNLIK